MSKKFTPQEMREMASVVLEDVYGNDEGGAVYPLFTSKFDENTIAEMLRHAADTYEKIEKEIKRLEDLLVPTCNNCVWGCVLRHGKESCKNHTWDGSNVHLVAKIKYLKEFING